MNGITVFTNEELNSELRTITFDDEPWFVAKDVCDSLDIQNVTQALEKAELDDDERSIFKIGRQGDTNIVSESGLYALVMNSRKPEAKDFKRWVRKEVLPSIRKTGNYSSESGDPVLILARKVLEQEDQLNTFKAKDRVFGNRTPLGEISDITGCPKQFPVRGHLRSDRRIKKVTVTEEYDLFYQLPEEVAGGEVAE